VTEKEQLLCQIVFQWHQFPKMVQHIMTQTCLKQEMRHWGSDNKQLWCGAGWGCFPQQHGQLKEFIRLQLNDKY